MLIIIIIVFEHRYTTRRGLEMDHMRPLLQYTSRADAIHVIHEYNTLGFDSSTSKKQKKRCSNPAYTMLQFLVRGVQKLTLFLNVLNGAILTPLQVQKTEGLKCTIQFMPKI